MVELEWVPSEGGVTLDSFELTTVPGGTGTAAPAGAAAPAGTAEDGAPGRPGTRTDPATTPRATSPGAPPPNACRIDPPDNEAGIAAAIGACPDGSTVVFPPNATYHQAGTIVVERRRDLVIDGNGSTFVKTSGNDPAQTRPNWELLEGRNVTVRNMAVRGAFTNPPSPRNPTLVPGPNQYDAGVLIYGGNGITVSDVSVSNVFGDFVTTAPSGFVRGGGALGGEVPTNVRIARLNGQHAARQCVAPTAAVGFWLVDSSLSDCQQTGVDVEMDVPGEPLHDVHIVGNTISGYYFSAITVPMPGQAGDVDGVEIRSNTLLTPPDTCYAPVLIVESANGASVANVVVASNQIQSLNNGVTYRDVASGAITGNRIEKTVGDFICGPPRPQPVVVVNSPAVPVTGNTAVGYTG
jgi:hypothetical protein